ncbi:PREDICTED: beta-1,3-N-acetylglucosaminyltransferase radical fringe [Bison bison bison]|uniref:Beta-1,3-N-acetylglucosaminyltransferase radical fringe n=1 Tax=Bison bison bison TaxID=43346 RepID=A0A6P3IRZ6_BISBB|nr:PREDICTED: beta-1,3-N-acetylglucosaminyltransferase radical fringe [Bison bison bison]
MMAHLWGGNQTPEDHCPGTPKGRYALPAAILTAASSKPRGRHGRPRPRIHPKTPYPQMCPQHGYPRNSSSKRKPGPSSTGDAAGGAGCPWLTTLPSPGSPNPGSPVQLHSPLLTRSRPCQAQSPWGGGLPLETSQVISLQTFIFTDGDDPELQLQGGGHVINTNCSAVHTRQALCCKMSVEYDKFIESGRKWFCHVDDDNYVNPKGLLQLLSTFSPSQDIYLGRPSLDHPIEATERIQGGGTVTTVKFWFATGGAGFCLSRGLALKMSPWASLGGFMSTAERVRLPDERTVGYIVEGLLGARLLHSSLFHSHLENLQKLSPDTLLQQVTLSYGGPENPQNVVNVAGGFSLQQDPTRFKSIHCLLYPDTDWCPVQKQSDLAPR